MVSESFANAGYDEVLAHPVPSSISSRVSLGGIEPATKKSLELQEILLSSPCLDYDDIPSTPSPSHTSFFDYSEGQQSLSFNAPVLVSNFCEPGGVPYGIGHLGMPNDFDFSCHAQFDAVSHYLVAPEACDLQVPAPPVLPPLLHVREKSIPPVPVFNADRPMFGDWRMEAFPALQGFQETGIVSSQASTADIAEIDLETAPVEGVACAQQNAEVSCCIFDDLRQGAIRMPSVGPGVFARQGPTDTKAARLERYAKDSRVLQLENFLTAGDDRDIESDGIRLGSEALPSVGSLGHGMRMCRPCAFVAKIGCGNGVQCEFCHLCEPGEKKRRRKEKKTLIAHRRLLNRGWHGQNFQASR
jgi:hypothetical protein|mmetsp:Transcript_51128/g.79912  ORF Transcript_51128/g.79912 Transcript_51128/m.79912 type:complete len:358 (-) Transcript_51128:263-1336(-)